MDKHTQAPWEAVDSLTVRGLYLPGDAMANGFCVARLPVTTPDEERRANAALIAAAPELLAVALEVEQLLSAQKFAPTGIGVENALLAAARAAIAKAEGH